MVNKFQVYFATAKKKGKYIVEIAFQPALDFNKMED